MLKADSHTTNLPTLATDVQLFQVAFSQSILRVLVGGNGVMARYPEILIDTALAGYDASRHRIAVTLTFKGIPIPLHLPATVTISDNSLQVNATTVWIINSGSATVSVLGGALRVAGKLRVELRIEAVAVRSR